MCTLGIVTRKVEEIDSREDYQEATEERNCVDRVGCVEALEKDEGCDECASCECHVIKRIYTVGTLAISQNIAGPEWLTCWC